MLTDKQIEKRKSGLFGTDASAIEGTSEFLGAYELYKIKRGEVSDEVAPNLAMALGHNCEPSNVKAIAKAINKKVRGSNRTIWNKKLLCPKGKPFLGAHLDGKVVGERTIVECKNVHYRAEAKWGEQGSDEIPPSYRSQIKHYCLVTGMRNVIVGAIFMSWPEHKIFNVTFSEEEIAELYEKEWGFWSRVQQGIEPSVDSTKGCEQALRRQWPRVIDTEDMAQSDETVDKTLLLMGKNKEEMKKLRDEESRLKNIIRQKMEDRPLLVHPEGYTVASYKEDKNGNRVLRIVK
jgi:putative phage-type endonuclease